MVILLIAACSQEEHASKAKMPAATDTIGVSIAGKVIETINAAGYTYVQVHTGSENVWAAAPEFQVRVGDQVVIPEGAPMRNFHSNTLNRDFPVIHFASSIVNRSGGTQAKGAEMPAGHPPTVVSSTRPPIDVSGVAKADGGIIIGELFADKAKLSGKQVTLRAKVVKFIGQVMGKSWLHVRDGSGDAHAHTNDLTVTTDVTVKVGDTVLVTGKVGLNKDFGYGYKYDVIIEDAKVTLE
jgi:hypothetical protein